VVHPVPAVSQLMDRVWQLHENNRDEQTRHYINRLGEPDQAAIRSMGLARDIVFFRRVDELRQEAETVMKPLASPYRPPIGSDQRPETPAEVPALSPSDAAIAAGVQAVFGLAATAQPQPSPMLNKASPP
jgi:hypothetical protein